MPVLLKRSPLYITVSRNSTESPSCPNVNVRLGWCLFRSSLNLSKAACVSVQTTNTSSR